MNHRRYLTRHFEERLGELDFEDKELLEDTIEFEEISEKIGRLF